MHLHNSYPAAYLQQPPTETDKCPSMEEQSLTNLLVGSIKKAYEGRASHRAAQERREHADVSRPVRLEIASCRLRCSLHIKVSAVISYFICDVRIKICQVLCVLKGRDHLCVAHSPSASCCLIAFCHCVRDCNANVKAAIPRSSVS